MDAREWRPFHFSRNPGSFWVSSHTLVLIIQVDNYEIISSTFNDFGPKFTCVDPTGEQPLTGMIVSVEKVYFGSS